MHAIYLLISNICYAKLSRSFRELIAFCLFGCKFYCIRFWFLCVPGSALLLFGCSNKVVTKLKSLQPQNTIDLNKTTVDTNISYPLSIESVTPENWGSSFNTFLIIIIFCFIFSFPGLLYYFKNIFKNGKKR
jgi:hypothetical protein